MMVYFAEEDDQYIDDDDIDLENDYYGDDDELLDPDILAEYQQYLAAEQQYELVPSCLVPTLADALSNYLVPILVANLVAMCLIRFLRLSPIVRLRFYLLQSFLCRYIPPLRHLVANLDQSILIVTGLALLTHYFRDESSELIAFLAGSLTVAALLVPLLLLSHTGFESGGGGGGSLFLLSLYCFLVISINESLIHLRSESGNYPKLRVTFMLLAMKSVSFFSEINNLGTDSPLAKAQTDLQRFGRLFIDFTAYLLHPSAIVLGVWHPHGPIGPSRNTDDGVVVTKSRSLLDSLWKGSLHFGLSLLFLLCSTCFIDYFLVRVVFYHLIRFLQQWIPGPVLGPFETFLWAYSNAIQFHFSHYFICFAAQSMFDLWDFRLTVTRPWLIEFPRSLVDVVIAWNIPMHLWLKKYVFMPLKHRYSVYLSILATYLISSYLHGFNFQIWSVLLTLGLLTQAEFKFRQRLAEIFGACIESRPCSYHSFDPNLDESLNEDGSRKPVILRCARSGHRHLGQSWFSPVRLVNFGFTLAAIGNLAFLGSTFDGKPDSSSLQHVWLIWKGLYFYSHVVALIMFVLYKLV